MSESNPLVNFTHITVAGSGVLGYQIAVQAAFHGFKVVVYDINDEVLNKAKTKFANIAKRHQDDLGETSEQAKQAEQNLRYTSDLTAALKDADLLIEAVPEDVAIKKDFYQKASAAAPEKTVFVSNSSTMLPSDLVKFTDRPAKFLMMHFANEIWKRNLAEIMSHADTDPNVFDAVTAFAKQIGMVPIIVNKETSGYVLNSLLNPWLNAGMQLYIQGIADIQTIDKTWMLGTGSPMGPFAFYDMLGLTTPYNIYKLAVAKGKQQDQAVVDMLKKDYIEKNKLGVPTGEGFYQYPNPAFKNPDFLKPPKADLSKVPYKNITVAGSGVLGNQIAVQCAFHGFNVTIYDINDGAIAKAKTRFTDLATQHQHDLGKTDAQVAAASNNLAYTTDLNEALKDADLLIEAVPESLDIKQDFYQKASAAAPAKTVFASNSSTLLPSVLSTFTNRPEKFLMLHFANHIHIRNTVELMAAPSCDPQVYADVIEFAKAIAMLPIAVKKEQSGYVLNSLLIPLLVAGLKLWANGVADAATIDKTWMIATGSPFGPMAILDKNGMKTNYNIFNELAKTDPSLQQPAEKLKAELVDTNKLGEATGEGFYQYPNPAYLAKDFLSLIH